jgi:hypothetical protein
MVLLHIKQVAVDPVPTMIAEGLEQIQPILGDQTNKLLTHLQLIEVRELTA